MKCRICDICERPIKGWESVTFKERIFVASYAGGTPLPTRAVRKVKVDMCSECHKEFIEYLEACAHVRKEAPNE